MSDAPTDTTAAASEMHVAIVVPAYNERTFLPRTVRALEELPRPVLEGPRGEVRTRYTCVLVDDGSTDGTREIVHELGNRPGFVAVELTPNRGKGAALAAGFEAARRLGVDAALVQDADLEYDPRDHARILQPVADGRADFVIGTRFRAGTHRAQFFWHSVANRALTELSNMLSGLAISDMECGFKCLTRPVLERLVIEEPGFGVEPELVAKIAAMELPDPVLGSRTSRVYEVDVTYNGRTYAEGKKIRWQDGVDALRCLVRYNLRR